MTARPSLAEIAGRHRLIEGVDICAYCDLSWPCDASIAVGMLTRLGEHVYEQDGSYEHCSADCIAALEAQP